MIEYLRGILLEREDNHLVVDVHGVGYGVTTPSSSSQKIGEIGSEVSLWILTYVREDILRLYGFATRHERELFEVFLGMSGVGPSVGLAVLSGMTHAEIVQAVLAGDTERFKKIKGIGQKMAEKLLLELKGRIKRLSAGIDPEELKAASVETASLRSEAAMDAVAALEALDVRPAQARKAIGLALEALGEDATVETLVREGLKFRR